jgi:DNA end-binding protein Ku
VWSGALSFGLVNVPVKLFSATASHDVHFHEYQAKTGQRIHHKRVAESSGREVAYEDIVKGYELSKGKVVLLEPEEIKALAPRRSRMIEIEQFVDLADIDPIVWDSPYYLGPGDETAAKSYELLRRAMDETGKVGIGRFVMRNKEYLVTVRPLGKGLVIETMHYQDEIRDQKEAVTELPARVNVNPRELGMAKQLIESLSTRWDHSKFEDTFRDQVQSLIQKKAKGQKIVVEEAPPEQGQVVDLMEALKASLHGGKRGRRGGKQRHAA